MIGPHFPKYSQTTKPVKAASSAKPSQSKIRLTLGLAVIDLNKFFSYHSCG